MIFCHPKAVQSIQHVTFFIPFLVFAQIFPKLKRFDWRSPENYLDGEQKSSTYKPAPNYIDGQQSNYRFVVNRTVRRTKYIDNYFEKIFM